MAEYEYTVINDCDGNDSFTIKGSCRIEALEKALSEIGWWVTDGESID